MLSLARIQGHWQEHKTEWDKSAACAAKTIFSHKVPEVLSESSIDQRSETLNTERAISLTSWNTKCVFAGICFLSARNIFRAEECLIQHKTYT